MPALVESKPSSGVQSTTLAKQWKLLYNKGKSQNPPVALATSAAFLYLAWALRSEGHFSHLASNNTVVFYSSAAALVLGIVPHTILGMTSTNDKLIASADNSSTAKDSEIDQLLNRWKVLNGIRGLWPLAGGLLGLAAVFC